MRLSENVLLKQVSLFKSYFPLFVKLKKYPLECRRNVYVQKEADSGKVLEEVARFGG